MENTLKINKREKKILIKHFINKKINTGLTNRFPIYIQVTTHRKTTYIPSRITKVLNDEILNHDKDYYEALFEMEKNNLKLVITSIPQWKGENFDLKLISYFYHDKFLDLATLCNVELTTALLSYLDDNDIEILSDSFPYHSNALVIFDLLKEEYPVINKFKSEIFSSHIWHLDVLINIVQANNSNFKVEPNLFYFLSPTIMDLCYNGFKNEFKKHFKSKYNFELLVSDIMKLIKKKPAYGIRDYHPFWNNLHEKIIKSNNV
ncbi:hypothetical protein [Emticicia sp. SJ17W-69]|uniref:hypothetical protein n=1 Tax=Emticicia sp. SJ17W-69 TaxID=3421657 RepID=UPI003EB82B8A